MQEAFQRASVRLTFTPTYNPQSNSVERTHRDLNTMLRLLCHQHAADWEEVLPAALLAPRSAVHESTGVTPFACLYGREPATPLDLVSKVPGTPLAAHTYVRRLEDHQFRAHRVVKVQLARALQPPVRRREGRHPTGREGVVVVVVVVLESSGICPIERVRFDPLLFNDFWSQNQQRAVAHLLLSPCSWPMISAIGGIRRNLLRSPGSQFAGVLLMRPIFLRSLSIAGHSHHRCIGSSSSSKHSLHSYAMPGSIRDLCFAK